MGERLGLAPLLSVHGVCADRDDVSGVPCSGSPFSTAFSVLSPRPAPATDRIRRAAVWTGGGVAVLVILGWLAPAPPAVLAVGIAVVHAVVFAGLVTLWSRALPRLRPVVLVSAVFAAVGVAAVLADPGPGWVTQTRALWADLAGIGLGWAVDRVYRRRPLPEVRLPRRPAPSDEADQPDEAPRATAPVSRPHESRRPTAPYETDRA